MSQADTERRIGQRKPANDSAVIVAGGEESPCVVLDICPTGARLCIGQMRPPSAFSLRFQGRRYDCETVWQNDLEIGVNFSDRQDPAERTEASAGGQTGKLDIRGLRSQLFGKGK